MATEAATTTGVVQRGTFLRRHRWKLLLLAVVLVGGGLFSLYTMAVMAFSYSKGDRVGYIQKLSKKGWLCRTWEGELAITQIPGAPPVVFDFSIRSDAVAAELAKAEGKRVSLTYEQKVGVPTTCFGETPYFVTGVRVVTQ
ncbi:MAG TPA: hypothetical protein VFH73_18195 [Polyangia bacterium]|jgi:hypothetical protein|nr:hypothetical protein [Polyangia bacterium]